MQTWLRLILTRILLGLVLFVRSASSDVTKSDVSFSYSSFLESLEKPPDFTIELAAGEPELRFPMFACFDDAGRLYVAESSGMDLYAGLQKLTRDCRVVRLHDEDADGRYESVVTCQDGITFPMGLAFKSGKLFVADPPDLVSLTDTDGDGRADRREVVLTGFGHTDNGSLHGLHFGPDGRLYFTMGEPDGWKFTRPDGSVLEGTAGALFRVNPDGSEVEVISRGFVNLVEVEFLPAGEIIGTDNWYQMPADGYRDALVDCAPGGLYPYAKNRGTSLPRTGFVLPPLILRSAVAHSGIAQPRTHFGPPAWRDNVFVAEHNTRRVVRHVLRREGSTFAAEPVDFVVGQHPDFHPSDVLEDADGSWLIVDTGGWYVEHCPTGRIRNSRAPGGIYRARWKGAAPVPDPRGRSILWTEVNPTELATRLRDRRPVVAERAAEELTKHWNLAELASALAVHETLDTRLRSIWALARTPTEQALEVVRSQLSTADPIVVAATARALALRRDRESGEQLAALLSSPSAFVRRAAAEALTTCGSSTQVPLLISALTCAGDAFEQHACVAALLEVADERSARTWLTHDSPRVRLAALNALDQPRVADLRVADLLPPLSDDDSELNQGARRLLERHPEWGVEVVQWLREELSDRSFNQHRVASLEPVFIQFQNEPSLRRLITEQFELDESAAEGKRIFLLRLVASLNAQPPEAAWLRAIGAGLTQTKFRSAALEAAATHLQADFGPLLARQAEDEQVPVTERLLAARLSDRHPQLNESVFALALTCLSTSAPPEERLQSVALLVRSKLSSEQSFRILTALRRGSPVPIEALLSAFERSDQPASHAALVKFLKERFDAGWSPSRATLDQMLALYESDPMNRERIRQAWEANRKDELVRIQEFTPLLTGGNVERGSKVFEAATCSGCHRVSGRGGTIGPDLTKVGAIRSGGDLLESILFPSSSFVQGYEPYLMVRGNGEEITGTLLARELDAFRIRDNAGFVHRVRSGDIQSVERQALSTMPEGLEQLMTPEQFRDLLAYLQSLK